MKNLITVKDIDTFNKLFRKKIKYEEEISKFSKSYKEESLIFTEQILSLILSNKKFPPFLKNYNKKFIKNENSIIIYNQFLENPILKIILNKDLKSNNSFESYFSNISVQVYEGLLKSKTNLVRFIFVGDVCNFIIKNETKLINSINKLVSKRIKHTNKIHSSIVLPLHNNYDKLNTKLNNHLFKNIYKLLKKDIIEFDAPNSPNGHVNEFFFRLDNGLALENIVFLQLINEDGNYIKLKVKNDKGLEYFLTKEKSLKEYVNSELVSRAYYIKNLPFDLLRQF